MTSAGRVSTWSIWLCGARAGHVRPRTPRRHPGSNTSTAGPQKLQSPATTAGVPGGGSSRASRRSCSGGPCGSRDVMWTATSRTGTPSTSISTSSTRRVGAGSPNVGPDRRRCEPAERQSGEHGDARLARAARASGGARTHPRSRGRSPRSGRRIRARPPRRRPAPSAIGSPHLLEHDHVGIELAERALEVVGLDRRTTRWVARRSAC